MIHVVLVRVVARYKALGVDALGCGTLPRAQGRRALHCKRYEVAVGVAHRAMSYVARVGDVSRDGAGRWCGGPEAGLLIGGTRPDLLDQFAAPPAATLLGDLPGASVMSGQKLGHSFFRLHDKEPAGEALVRRVTGMSIELRVNRRYLTPILLGPKEIAGLRSGRPENWLLTLPKELPRNGAIHDGGADCGTPNCDKDPATGHESVHTVALMKWAHKLRMNRRWPTGTIPSWCASLASGVTRRYPV